MFVIGSLVSNVSAGTGLAATAIAVAGFLLHAVPALSGASEETLRRATVTGGLLGFIGALLVILLSAFID
jgi:hypothetical protein